MSIISHSQLFTSSQLDTAFILFKVKRGANEAYTCFHLFRLKILFDISFFVSQEILPLLVSKSPSICSQIQPSPLPLNLHLQFLSLHWLLLCSKMDVLLFLRKETMLFFSRCITKLSFPSLTSISKV